MMMYKQLSRPAKGQLRRADFDVAWFENLFQASDRLHTEICAGDLHTISSLPPALILGWLDDIIYTLQEARAELEGQSRPVTQATPVPANPGRRIESED